MKTVCATILILASSSAWAAETAFTKDEIQAAYALGRADLAREQISSTAAGQSLASKMKGEDKTATPAPRPTPLTSPKAPAPASAK